MRMDKSAKKKKKGTKPLRRAKHWQAQAPHMAGRMVLSVLLTLMLGMMSSVLQGIGTLWLRFLLALAVAAVTLMMYFVEGLTKGGDDAAASRFYMQMEKAGHKLDASDDESCYHPLKAVCACAIVYSVPLVLALVLSVTAQPYTYTLQDLPTWLTGSFGGRADVMGPLGAYTQTRASIGPLGWVRVVVRLLIMCYVNLFADPLRMTGTIDRLCPLFLLTYPLAYALGYLCGPRMQKKREKENRHAKKVALRKAQKSNLASELVGVQNAVHYGQRPDAEKPKKKELI